jgi:hypothetical protein
MARLHHAAGDDKLAIRFLRLYVQVVSKAREAASADGSTPETAGKLNGPGVEEMDSDVEWVRACVQGARMLCRVALSETGAQGVEEAREAGKMIVHARSRLNSADKELVASVDLAEGIWNNVMSIKGQIPSSTSLVI